MAACLGDDLLFDHHDDGLFNDNDLDDDLLGDNDHNDPDDNCDVDDLAELATKICAVVLGGVSDADMKEAGRVVEDAMAQNGGQGQGQGGNGRSAAGRVMGGGSALAAVALGVVAFVL